MASLPSGTITFLFTDVEGSTQLWERFPESMRLALARHDEILREVIERHNGFIFKTVGDAFCAAFHTAPEALNAALDAHLALANQEWDETGPIRVRMGLHTGTAEERDNDYFGPTVNRVARLLAAGHGQQILISQATYELVKSSVPVNSALRDMGEHRLKDLASPEHIWQLLHPSLPQEFSPLKSLDYLPTNLPIQSSSFVGREKEMNEIQRLLSGTRLLTVTGAGGSGKSRLAQQVGAELLDEYTDGVWLVELESLSAGNQITSTVAAALRIREQKGWSIDDLLTSVLQSKHMLILLDSCEHLVEECAGIVDSLLKKCPRIKVMSTSQRPLNLYGEKTYPVPSLSLPPPVNGQLQPNADYSVLVRSEAVKLFIGRADVRNPNFNPKAHDLSLIGQICRRLDGIPLAIELAAARTRAITVEQILQRLDDRFALLTGGSRTSQTRQQTMRATMDWSYSLLGHPEKVLLNRLSVFAGGWTLDAAESACSSDGVGGSELLDLLTSLVDFSLVVFNETVDRGRYRLLETVRHYARERLDEIGETTLWHTRHFYFYLALAEQAALQLDGGEQVEWLQRLAVEHDNLRVALEWSLTQSGSLEALRLCSSLQRFWSTRGYLTEGRDWSERVLDMAEDPEWKPERVKVLNGAGILSRLQGDYTSALQYYEESLAFFRQIEDLSGIVTILNNLGSAYSAQSDYTAARSNYEESLSVWRHNGDRIGIIASLNNLANLDLAQGDCDSARASFEECLFLSRQMEDLSGIADSLNNLGLVAFAQGDCPSARGFYEESLTLRREINDPSGIAASLNNLGSVSCAEGDYSSARAYHEKSLTIEREIRNIGGAATSLLNLGNVAACQSEFALARTYVEQSLGIQREIGDKAGTADSLRILGSVSNSEGEYGTALAYSNESLAIHREIGDQRGISDSLLSLGNVFFSQGDYASARRHTEKSLSIKRNIGDTNGIADALLNLSNSVHLQGDYALARTYAEECLRIKQDIGDRRGVALSLNNLGCMAYHEREYAASRAYYGGSLSARRKIGDRLGIAQSLESFSPLLTAENQPRRAAQLWGAAELLREQIGAPLPPNEREEYDHHVAEARQELGDEEFNKAWAAGRAMSMEEAVELALEKVGSSL